MARVLSLCGDMASSILGSTFPLCRWLLFGERTLIRLSGPSACSGTPSDSSHPDVPSPQPEGPMDTNGGTPGYSDPNLPMQPPPGLGPPDADMPPPDEDMPAGQNSQQPPDDPPPPGGRRERSRSRDRQSSPARPQPFLPANQHPDDLPSPDDLPPPGARRGRNRYRERQPMVPGNQPPGPPPGDDKDMPALPAPRLPTPPPRERTRSPRPGKIHLRLVRGRRKRMKKRKSQVPRMDQVLHEECGIPRTKR